MDKLIKNMEPAVALSLADQVQYLEGQIVSRTLAQNKHLSLTLFAFDQGEEISAHDSQGDALVLVLDGEGTFTVGDKAHTLSEGQALVMPARIPHAVSAARRFKMLLTVVFPEN